MTADHDTSQMQQHPCSTTSSHAAMPVQNPRTGKDIHTRPYYVDHAEIYVTDIVIEGRSHPKRPDIWSGYSKNKVRTDTNSRRDPTSLSRYEETAHRCRKNSTQLRPPLLLPGPLPPVLPLPLPLPPALPLPLPPDLDPLFLARWASASLRRRLASTTRRMDAVSGAVPNSARRS